jgi:hypothetical protein
VYVQASEFFLMITNAASEYNASTPHTHAGQLIGRIARAALMFAATLMAACATAPPVQEMSDARQAMQAARAANAAEKAPSDYIKARAHILHAETALENGNYRDAREHAAWAKTHALEARQRALAQTARDN